MKIGFWEIKPGDQEYFAENLKDHKLSFTKDLIQPGYKFSETDYQILCIRSDSKIDSQIIDQLPNLKLIATRTTGFDHIDLKAAENKGILVCNVPTYGSDTVAEYTFALLLNLSRKITDAINQVKQSNYQTDDLQGFDLNQKTLGVVGTGKIGENVIRIARGFDMNVIAFDAFPRKELETSINFKYVTFEELLSQSDIITLHTPYLPSTHHLINQKSIQLIKKGAVIINTSRGGVIETDALVKALESKILSGAALDVLEEENALKDERLLLKEGDSRDQIFKTVLENHILLTFPNVIITPHNAFNTREAQLRISKTTVENINSFLNNQPTNTVKSS